MLESQTQPLAIVGAGSLGLVYAGLLAASGQPATVLATQSTAERILQTGHVSGYGAAKFDVSVTSAPAPIGKVGVTADAVHLPRDAGLIFMTKAHQLPAAIASVQTAWPVSDDQLSWVAGVQNGVVKDDLLRRAFGPERTVGMASMVAGEREAGGPVRITGLGNTYIGEFDGKLSPRVISAVASLEQAGLPAAAMPDIQRVLWSKVCHAAGVFGVCAPLRVSGPELLGQADLMRAYLALLRESAAIARASGVEVGNYAGLPVEDYLGRPEAETLADGAKKAGNLTTRARGYASVPSMAQDLLAGRSVEVDEIFGDLVERAERLGVPAPCLTFVRDLIRGLDPGRNGAAPASGGSST